MVDSTKNGRIVPGPPTIRRLGKFVDVVVLDAVDDGVIVVVTGDGDGAADPSFDTLTLSSFSSSPSVISPLAPRPRPRPPAVCFVPKRFNDWFGRVCDRRGNRLGGNFRETDDDDNNVGADGGDPDEDD